MCIPACKLFLEVGGSLCEWCYSTTHAALETGQWLPGNHQLLGRSAYFLHSWQEVARDCKKCHVRMVAPKTSWRLVCKHSRNFFQRSGTEKCNANCESNHKNVQRPLCTTTDFPWQQPATPFQTFREYTVVDSDRTLLLWSLTAL